MSEINNVGPSPENPPSYRMEFQEGVKLFKDSLQEYSKSSETHQKVEFKKVMEKALKIMNQSAKAALSESVQTKEKKLEDDYHSFLNNDSDETRAKLEKDISDLESTS